MRCCARWDRPNGHVGYKTAYLKIYALSDALIRCTGELTRHSLNIVLTRTTSQVISLSIRTTQYICTELWKFLHYTTVVTGVSAVALTTALVAAPASAAGTNSSASHAPFGTITSKPGECVIGNPNTGFGTTA